jgi:hypothetical protein
MLQIQPSFSTGVVQGMRAMQQNLPAGTTQFDALLFSARTNANSGAKGSADNILGNGNGLSGFIDALFENIQNSRMKAFNANSANFAPQFSFSSSFVSTFGLSGPLPNFITLMTAKLKLSATQNLALQDIAIANKDIVKTPESVQKIAAELKEAGITA